MLQYNKNGQGVDKMDNELKEMFELMSSKIDEKLDLMNFKFSEQLSDIKRELASNREEMKVVNYKLDRHTEKIDGLDLRLRNAETNIRKDIKKLSDENETIIEVLKQHELLPR